MTDERKSGLPGNLLREIPANLAQELIQPLVDVRNVRIERIVSLGHRSAPDFWYDQPEHEWVVIVSGSARLMFEDGTLIEMSAGDWLNIPAHQKHRVDWTDPAAATVWLAVFYS